MESSVHAAKDRSELLHSLLWCAHINVFLLEKLYLMTASLSFMKFRRCYELLIVSVIVAFLTYLWVSRFGFSLPSAEVTVPFEADAWLLVFLGIVATLSALVPLFLEFKFSSSAVLISWVLYFPVLFNVLVPMFIPFFSVIGIFYTPWLPFTDLDYTGRLIHGTIRLPDETLQRAIGLLGYIVIAVGLIIYSISLYQLLTHVGKARTLMTRGFYGFSRHPQYFGIILWTLGFAITGKRLINYLMWLTLSYSYVLLAEHEESKLEKTYGHEYTAYKSRVPFLIPTPKINLKPFSKLAANRKARILFYTLLYVLLTLAFYFLLNPYVVMTR
jgi:protein-S-isoprenylcysteine O-methyltransferase Ste14